MSFLVPFLMGYGIQVSAGGNIDMLTTILRPLLVSHEALFSNKQDYSIMLGVLSKGGDTRNIWQ